ncbi:hypothetical protein, partial [Psychroserpens mesophilus]|uniref:hypothetical protein n=1 Tax=Psychroserpens mesophilus TaxID=325473 RepID=UPI003F49074F
LSIINENLVENGVVNTNLRYTYNDDFNSIAGSFDISVLTTVNIFGTWNYSETGCGSSEFEYTGPFTLNDDYTVTLEDDSSGNYMVNNFTFENNVLLINTQYMDPTCNDTQFRLETNTWQLNYNSSMDTFSGTGNTVKEAIVAPNCNLDTYNCNYDVTMSR